MLAQTTSVLTACPSSLEREVVILLGTSPSVIDTLAASYLTSTAVTLGAASEIAAARKVAKYVDLANMRFFVPLTFETLGPICDGGLPILDDLGGPS